MRSIVFAFALCVTVMAQEPGQAPAPQPDDPIKTIAARLDLEKYKATIKGLTQFGDRRQGTARNRAAIDWIEAQLKSYGCGDVQRLTYTFTPRVPGQGGRGRGQADPTQGQGGSRIRG